VIDAEDAQAGIADVVQKLRGGSGTTVVHDDQLDPAVVCATQFIDYAARGTNRAIARPSARAA
jgi:hypothetical protein